MSRTSTAPSITPTTITTKMGASRVQARINRRETRKLSAAMLSAASRFIFFGLVLVASLLTQAADVPVRAAPSRPSAPATVATANAPTSTTGISGRRFGSVDYVCASDIAARLGLKATALDRGRKMSLTGQSVRAELENDTRDITVNGTRVLLGEPILDAGGQLYVSRI